jgi:5-hydroxyisourate hydrolase
MREQITTHVLDLHSGQPAEGIGVRLERVCAAEDQLIATASTDAEGRIERWDGPFELERGGYRLRFAVAAHFAARGVESFYDQIEIRFVVRDPEAQHHVPLVLSPFGYSTYRGS